MVTKEQPLFIVEVDGATSAWLPLGGEFHGFRISAFDPTTETLAVDNFAAKASLPLKASKVSAAPVDPNGLLRMLKGLPLAYEVARRGDENTRLILIRYQQALAGANGDKAHQDALEFLRTQVDRLAANGAQQILSQEPNPESSVSAQPDTGHMLNKPVSK